MSSGNKRGEISLYAASRGWYNAAKSYVPQETVPANESQVSYLQLPLPNLRHHVASHGWPLTSQRATWIRPSKLETAAQGPVTVEAAFALLTQNAQEQGSQASNVSTSGSISRSRTPRFTRNNRTHQQLLADLPPLTTNTSSAYSTPNTNFGISTPADEVHTTADFRTEHLRSTMSSTNFRDIGGVGDGLKDTINHLFEIQQRVHGFVPDQQDLLTQKVSDLADSLGNLQHLTSKETSPNNPIHDVLIAPDIIDYVDDGRNPDIYTRDFVELVQRGNAVLNGRQKAFRDFSLELAEQIKNGIPELGEEVDKIMTNAGLDAQVERRMSKQNGNA